MNWLNAHPWWTAIFGAVLAVLADVPFSFVNPLPFYGLPGAVAVALIIAVAAAAGPLPGLLVAGVAGVDFVLIAHRSSVPLENAAHFATVSIWIVLALATGLIADRLRRRLTAAFSEVEDQGEQLRLTLDAAAAAVGLFVGADLRCRNANSRLRHLFATTDWFDRPLLELLPSLDPGLRDELRACAVGGAPHVRRDEITLADERTFILSARCLPTADEMAVFLTLTDVSASVRVRRALERLLELSRELHVTATPSQVAESMCRVALEMFECQTASYWTVDDTGVRIVARIPESPPIERWKLDEIGDLKAIIDTREPLFVQDVQEHYHTATRQHPTLLQRYLRDSGQRSLLGLPVAYGGQVGALIFLAWTEPVEYPTDELLVVARRFADAAAIAVERAERLAAQEEAERLHQRLEASLLPRMRFADSTVDLHYRYRASERRMLIGGDFLGAVSRPGGDLTVIIGDVSGHGPDAAALGATLRASWRVMALEGSMPLEILRRLNQIVIADRFDDSEFATVAIVSVDAERSHAQVVLAGHHPPLLLTDEDVSEMSAPFGVPLGVFDQPTWETGLVELPDKWSIMLYTDGLIEGYASPRSAARYGIRRLQRLLRAEGFRTQVSDDHLDHLLDEVKAANGGPFGDDVAVLTVSGRRLSLASHLAPSASLTSQVNERVMPGPQL
jgi:serine phosphatase RsbU (regulator of sigma subunit)